MSDNLDEAREIGRDFEEICSKGSPEKIRQTCELLMSSVSAGMAGLPPVTREAAAATFLDFMWCGGLSVRARSGASEATWAVAGRAMALDQALQGNQIILNAAWLQAHNCDCAICEELRKSLRERRASWIATAARLETLLKEDLAATEELERWLRTLGATAREHIWSIPAVHPDIEEDHIGRSLPSMAAYFEFRELQVQAMASEWVEGGWWRFDDQTPDAPPQPWDGTPGHAGGVCVFLWTFDDGTHADQVENNAVDLERMLRECGVIESPQT